MLVLKHSLLNREIYSNRCSEGLGCVHFHMYSHVTFLAKITPRYFTLFTNAMFRPFNVDGTQVVVCKHTTETGNCNATTISR
jgi:hypothetical protein